MAEWRSREGALARREGSGLIMAIWRRDRRNDHALPRLVGGGSERSGTDPSVPDAALEGPSAAVPDGWGHLAGRRASVGEEGEGANLDAFPGRGTRGRGGIVEGAMGGEPRPAIQIRIVALDHHGLVGLHLREAEPAVPRAVGDLI